MHSLKNMHTSKISLWTAVLALFIMFESCNKEEQVIVKDPYSVNFLYDKGGVEKAELDQKLNYKNYHLTKLMEEAIRKKLDFDGQKTNNFLKGRSNEDILFFKDLLTQNQTGKGEEQLRDSIRFSLEAFIDLEGESWYPYVYKIKEGRGNGPLFLINSFNPDTEKEIVEGYTLDAVGKLELKYRDVSEEDIFGPNPIPVALGNDVYVLGLSSEDQEYVLPEDENSDSYGGGGGTNNDYVKLEYVKIKDKKESWLEKADVKFEVVTANPYALTPGDFLTHCGVNVGLGCYWNGSFLAHCNNSEVGKKRLLNREMGIIQTGTFANIAAYVIFEYDSWPAGVKVYEETINGATIKVGYRSYQLPYDEVMANFHDQNPFNLMNGRKLERNNNYIEYNLK